MSTEPDRSLTPRGFVIYDQFKDTYGSEIRIQHSSAATRTCVWIFADGEDDSTSSPHLDVEQAKRVRDALDVFIRENEDA